jgi:hypothetical protein
LNDLTGLVLSGGRPFFIISGCPFEFAVIRSWRENKLLPKEGNTFASLVWRLGAGKSMSLGDIHLLPEVGQGDVVPFANSEQDCMEALFMEMLHGQLPAWGGYPCGKQLNRLRESEMHLGSSISSRSLESTCSRAPVGSDIDMDCNPSFHSFVPFFAWHS